VSAALSHFDPFKVSSYIPQVRLLPVLLLLVSSVHDQDALVLLHRMQTALCDPRLAGVRDLDWTVRANVFDGNGHDAGIAVRHIRVILPYEFRKDGHVPSRRTSWADDAYTVLLQSEFGLVNFR
jgi:hypothetical protein